MRIPNYYTLHMILIDVSVGLAAPYKTFEYGRVAVLCMNEQNRSCGVIIMILYRFRRFSLLHVVWSPNICSKESDDNIFFVYLHSIPSWFTCFCSQFFSFFLTLRDFLYYFFFVLNIKAPLKSNGYVRTYDELTISGEELWLNEIELAQIGVRDIKASIGRITFYKVTIREFRIDI